MTLAAVITPAELWFVLAGVLVVVGASRLPGVLRKLRDRGQEHRPVADPPRSASA